MRVLLSLARNTMRAPSPEGAVSDVMLIDLLLGGESWISDDLGLC